MYTPLDNPLSPIVNYFLMTTFVPACTSYLEADGPSSLQHQSTFAPEKNMLGTSPVDAEYHKLHEHGSTRGSSRKAKKPPRPPPKYRKNPSPPPPAPSPSPIPPSPRWPHKSKAHASLALLFVFPCMKKSTILSDLTHFCPLVMVKHSWFYSILFLMGDTCLNLPGYKALNIVIALYIWSRM